jgi:hypothetical protein
MEKQNFEFGGIRPKYGIVNTFPYFGDLGYRDRQPVNRDLPVARERFSDSSLLTDSRSSWVESNSY